MGEDGWKIPNGDTCAAVWIHAILQVGLRRSWQFGIVRLATKSSGTTGNSLLFDTAVCKALAAEIVPEQGLVRSVAEK